jgi:hypothetical protein
MNPNADDTYDRLLEEETGRFAGSCYGSKSTTPDVLQSYCEDSCARSIPSGIINMGFLPAIASVLSYNASPIRSLELMSSTDSYHTRQTRPDLGASAQGSYDRRVQARGGRVAQWCNPDRVRPLLVNTWVGSTDRVLPL